MAFQSMTFCRTFPGHGVFRLSKLGTVSVWYKPYVRFMVLMTHTSIVVLKGNVYSTEERGPKENVTDVHS